MSNQVQEIQIDITEAQNKMKDADALDRLHKNPDFKKIILEGYFQQQAAGLVAMRAHPAMQAETQQANLLRSIDAVGELQQFFSGIFQQGNTAKEAITQSEIELAEMADEGEI